MIVKINFNLSKANKDCRQYSRVIFYLSKELLNYFIFASGRAMASEPMENPPSSPIIKSISTPVNLQTIVRIQNGSNMSLHHRVSSNALKGTRQT